MSGKAAGALGSGVRLMDRNTAVPLEPGVRLDRNTAAPLGSGVCLMNINTAGPTPLAMEVRLNGKTTAAPLASSSRVRVTSKTARPLAAAAMCLALVGLLESPLPLASAAVPPSCSPASQEMAVSNAVGLAALVRAANCSEGEFLVSWEGAVVFEEPIVVGNSTRLAITGVGAGAALDGGGVTRLLNVREGEDGGRGGVLMP